MTRKSSKRWTPQWFYIGWLAILLCISLVILVTKAHYGLLVVWAAVLAVYAFRPGSAVYRITLEREDLVRTACTWLLAVCTMLMCVKPMDAFPLWNGEVPGHRNQYELMAENLLEGRLHFDYGDEDQLLKLENPYDPDERKESGVRYHWDHAYYNGRYYMYFGVVPVLLVFLPYRVLTGQSLTTFHATQIFTAVSIAGIFTLFRLLSRLFFKKMPYGVYLALSVAVSVMSVWYATAEPALYCTAITAAMALQIWSLYFFIRAVWGEKEENKQILFAAVGALLGALVFGCRPPIALANLLVIPMLAEFLRQRKFSGKLLGKLALAALPYAVVAAGLMWYNNARFGDPLEFGQKYQLTVADQSQYGFQLSASLLVRLFNDTVSHLFGISKLTVGFPYLKHGGVFLNFPILFLTAAFFLKPVGQKLREHRLTGLVSTLALTVLVITVMDILWTPYLLERYRMDVYFLVGIGCFLAIGLWQDTMEIGEQRQLSAGAVLLSVVTVVSSFLFCMRTVSVYYPETMEEVYQKLIVWLTI